MTPTVLPLVVPQNAEGRSVRSPEPAIGGFAAALASSQSAPFSAPTATPSAPTATPMRAGEAAAAISSAYESVFGTPPSKATLSVLVSQWSLETGGGQSMMNYNFGGIKGQSPSGQSVSYLTTEGSDADAHSIVDSFRAYGSAREGAADYIRLLRDHYPDALGQARAGNPSGFVHALKRGGYFTGSEKAYASAVSSSARQMFASGFAGVSLGPGGNLLASQAGGLAEDEHPNVDIAAFSYQLDLAALRIGADPNDG